MSLYIEWGQIFYYHRNKISLFIYKFSTQYCDIVKDIYVWSKKGHQTDTVLFSHLT